ncbi:MAG: hypothetical protein LBI10_11355 [Deltaproteobacteria bacterium]|jgi:hypothetical protein|nr:hypothetical protein [Deltaproteobacteria bacterium]
MRQNNAKIQKDVKIMYQYVYAFKQLALEKENAKKDSGKQYNQDFIDYLERYLKENSSKKRPS